MNPGTLDDFVRQSIPPNEIDRDRVDRVMASVLAAVDDTPARRGWAQALADLFAVPGWVGQYAIPLCLAAVLGVLAGGQLAPSSGEAHLGTLLASSSSLPYLGY